MDNLDKLRPVEFKWKKNDKISYGFIAQEVQKIFPNMVKEDDSYLSMDYIQVIPLCVNKIQKQNKQLNEQNKQLNEQNNTINSLKKQLNEQEEKINKIEKIIECIGDIIKVNF